MTNQVDINTTNVLFIFYLYSIYNERDVLFIFKRNLKDEEDKKVGVGDTLKLLE